MNNPLNPLSSLQLPINHPQFYQRVFTQVVKEKKHINTKNLLCQILTDDYELLSRRLDFSKIQESCTVRNVLRTRKLAQTLINQNGEVQIELIPEAIECLKKHLYSLGPSRQFDAARQLHILNVLNFLLNNKSLVSFFKKITRPISNKWLEEMIRHALHLPPHVIINDVHAKQAVLAAWLCTLRQNVGSCFATAPAIIIHDEQPESFLQDMLNLMETGRLTRIFEGIEHIVPLSASWGNGELNKPILVHSSDKGISPEIWYSPGLTAAAEAAGCLPATLGSKEKIQQLKKWIQPFLSRTNTYTSYYVTAEELIRLILMQHLDLNFQQIKEYENRPINPTIQNTLVIQTPKSAKKQKGIRERCEEYFNLFEIAKNAFKALADNALLKCWEYTLASFSETKFDFADWNLYESLGLETNAPNGIGQCIYQYVQNKLDILNRENKELEYEYEGMLAQVRTLESRIRQTSTEQEMNWLKMEYRSRVGELHFLQEQREEGQYRAKAIVNLYDTLYKLYTELFREYFQEVYDADMQDIQSNPFDDSPAGFRLLYKHGRSNPSQWTLIKNHHEYIEALSSFFVATESQIFHSLETERMEKELSEIVSTIILHIKTNEFIESAFERMARAHQVPAIKNPLENLDKIEKKPWVFTSGGVMTTLVSSYYRINQKPTVTEKWVESETELFVFLADTLKLIPYKDLEPFRLGVKQSMLMQSPTHAFILKPFLSPFKEAWQNESFTFTDIRDRFILPAESFIESLLLNDEMIRLIIQQLISKISANFQPRFKLVCERITGPLNPIFFREQLVELISKDKGLQDRRNMVLHPDEIDSLLFQQLPFFHKDELRDRLQNLTQQLPGLTEEQINLFFG
ncbi:MAG: hypothetical protein Q8K60_00605 [Parachlamydiaceae bacterium]|nr:hypothetical protein [Parachlamydiaceae bacterium]